MFQQLLAANPAMMQTFINDNTGTLESALLERCDRTTR